MYIQIATNDQTEMERVMVEQVRNGGFSYASLRVVDGRWSATIVREDERREEPAVLKLLATSE